MSAGTRQLLVTSAGRLESWAEPGEVVIGRGAYRPEVTVLEDLYGANTRTRRW